MADQTREYAKALARIQVQYRILGERTAKDRKVYVFLGRTGSGFTGNTKYLFLHFLRHLPDAEAWFLTQDRDLHRQLAAARLPCLLFPTDRAVEVLARAATVVVESISFRNALYYPLIEKARQIQLWHGVGNKKIGFLLQGHPILAGRDQTLMEDHSDYDLIVSTSPFYTEEVFKPSMDAREFVSLGYPRTDVFYRQPDRNDLVGCDVQAYGAVRAAKRQGKKILLFAPTFRDTDVNPLTQNVLDLPEFFAFLEKRGVHLVLKPHVRVPVQATALPANVTLCHAASDVYPFFSLTDLMITDYSSIFTEFLLLDRPVLFFWADYDSYTAVDRGFQFPMEDMAPGPRCRDAASLYQAISAALAGQDPHAEERRALRDKAFLHQDGRAAERIAAHILHGEWALRPRTDGEEQTDPST